MKKSNVFISSTYSDLKEHRKQIWITLEKFDVNIFGMEKFGARKEDSLTTCLKEVENSDIFILIVGMRFGSIDKKSQKSYTWLEYEKARELNKDILVYLINDKNGKIEVSDFDIENYQKLVDFKDILKENHTVDIFVNVDDLTEKIFSIVEKKTKEGRKELVRPEKIECQNLRFTVDEQKKYIIFIGFLNNRPYEILTCPSDDEDGVLIPRGITNGYLVERWEDENQTRIDFQYINSRGYKTTIEGIDYFSHDNFKFSILDKMVSSLLKDNVETYAIKNMMKHFCRSDSDLRKWNRTVLNILK